MEEQSDLDRLTFLLKEVENIYRYDEDISVQKIWIHWKFCKALQDQNTPAMLLNSAVIIAVSEKVLIINNNIIDKKNIYFV